MAIPGEQRRGLVDRMLAGDRRALARAISIVEHGGADARTVHSRQHYELVHYLRGNTELNYRRFFAVTTLAGLYLGVQIVRQVPLTPGGVGVIDTAFVAGLTAAGATAVTATAAVLVYRLISCWLIIPIGGATGLALRRE